MEIQHTKVLSRGIDHEATGAVIRTERKARGLTMLAVASEMNISIPYLRDLENGNRNWNTDLFAKAKNAITKLA